MILRDRLRCPEPAPSRRQLLLGAATGLLLPGCTLNPDRDHDDADAPTSEVPLFAGPASSRPITAWVLSSGGPRGFVHVGVLKALDELGLRPDLIVGASVGAFIGVLRAGGRSGREIEALALELRPWWLARLAVGTPEHLSGAPLADYVRSQTGEHLLERLPIPAVCVATRMSDGVAVGFNRGDIGLAVQAASAIEGRFAPVRIRGQRYLDADQTLPLPVRMARALGATRVLAVDASAHEDRAPAGAEHYRVGDLHKRALTAPDARAADVLLHPDFGYWVSLSREFRERAIAAGYRATLADAARIRALHGA
ncbi:Patatin [Leptothrix cholodnii SP-6]|uniref:Patatin n=1 Tax=Leptothrix cholodnii (strain ATCC 51168 / LMG 8142 / SP-6) TaxID=395495 RepID=B1XY81_LEPCP|nr:patatin-like phospholipase family protein [Leptothrix cholodnii]ACB33982.1 Patatin [Leptothrix cholodnii SP-6]